MTTIRFALNHITTPALSPEAFFALAKSIGIDNVEIRNDLSGNAIIDGTPASDIRSAAHASGMTILSINALQRFNEWNDARATEAEALIAYARDCGAKALVLVPVNDGSGKEDGVRQANLRQALTALKPMLQAAGIVGLVEPLGFEICSLSSKSEAADAIGAVGGAGVFKLVHDTFHHYLAGEPEIFADLTGLVHISGVSDPNVSDGEMRDSHRVLVDAGDRLDNAGQVKALVASGYAGPFSFEPFAAEVQTLDDPAAALKRSMDYLQSSI